MLRFRAAPYLAVLAGLQDIEARAQTMDGASKDGLVADVLPNGFYDDDNDLYDRIRQACEYLGLSLSLKQLQRVASIRISHGTTVRDLENAITQLRLRIIDELDERVFLHLPPRLAGYFDAPSFHPDIATVVPSATLDIEEAAKCLAVGRWTACVFHLMRVMEHGMNTLAKHAGIEMTYQTWDKKIERLSVFFVEELRKPYGESRFAGRLDFFKQATERLTAVQHALRNETMHARSFYDEERAIDVYRSVKAFMEQLAANLKA